MPMANSPPRRRRANGESGNESTDDQTPEKKRGVGFHAPIGQPDRSIGAEAEKRLLTHGYQSAIASERIPRRGHHHVNEEGRKRSVR